MLINANTVSTSVMRRRSLLGFLVLAAVPLGGRARAATLSDSPTETIRVFNASLLAAMKSGDRASFASRFQMLAPAVDQAFDLSALLAVSVGSGWTSLSEGQQSRLAEAFRRYTVASYVANFDRYAGQTITVLPDMRSAGADRVIVQSRITPVSGDSIEMDYVMRPTASGWKVIDILAAGSISRVAVQRSDFRRLMTSGGGDALLTSLERKTSDLSGGAPA